MKENQQLIVFMHLSQLFNLFSGFLGFIIPLVIWQSKKKKHLRFRCTWKSDYQFSNFLIYSYNLLFSVSTFSRHRTYRIVYSNSCIPSFPITECGTSECRIPSQLPDSVRICRLNRFGEGYSFFMQTIFVILPHLLNSFVFF